MPVRNNTEKKTKKKKKQCFVANTQSDEIKNVDKQKKKDRTMIEKTHAKACVSFLVFKYHLVIQDHDLQRNPVVFLPRNRDGKLESIVT